VKAKQIERLWEKEMPTTPLPSAKWLSYWASSNSNATLREAIRLTGTTNTSDVPASAVHKLCSFMLRNLREGRRDIARAAAYSNSTSVNTDGMALRPLPPSLTGSWQAFPAKPDSQPEERLDEPCWHYEPVLESGEQSNSSAC
jgi:hypothetical protein